MKSLIILNIMQDSNFEKCDFETPFSFPLRKYLSNIGIAAQLSRNLNSTGSWVSDKSHFACRQGVLGWLGHVLVNVNNPGFVYINKNVYIVFNFIRTFENKTLVLGLHSSLKFKVLVKSIKAFVYCHTQQKMLSNFS